MKLFYTIVIVFLSVLFSKAQTKILGSSIDWQTGSLTVFLSDSVAISSLNVTLGTQADSTDLLNTSFANPLVSNSMIIVSLGTFTPRDYYVDVKVNLLDAVVDEMEYKSTYAN